MEAPKFIKCPECNSKYDDTKKRRIIDSCGHPRCYSCLFVNNPCLVCEKLLRRRSKSWISSRESLLSTDEDQDTGKCTRFLNKVATKMPLVTSHPITLTAKKSMKMKFSSADKIYHDFSQEDPISFPEPSPRHANERSEGSGNEIEEDPNIMVICKIPKHHYLRTLYSYDPGSQENIYHSKNLSYRRGSLDITSQTENRRIKLGQYSASALALTTNSQKSGVYPKSTKESISGNWSRSSSSPKKYLISRELSASAQSLSSSPGMTKRIFDDIMEDDKYTKSHNDLSSFLQPALVASPRSSGYWSEMESYSDYETEKTSSSTHRSDSGSAREKSMRELASIDAVLSGNSSAWENTKALFQPPSSDVLSDTLEISFKEKFESGKRNTDVKERRHSAPEWHFKKVLDNHKKQARIRTVKVTDL